MMSHEEDMADQSQSCASKEMKTVTSHVATENCEFTDENEDGEKIVEENNSCSGSDIDEPPKYIEDAP